MKPSPCGVEFAIFYRDGISESFGVGCSCSTSFAASSIIFFNPSYLLSAALDSEKIALSGSSNRFMNSS